MRFSAFNPPGHFRFTGRKPYGEVIYREMIRNQGDGKVYSNEWGSLNSASLYADAMVFARARHFLERTGKQFRPGKAVELLPYLEHLTGVVPGRTATVPQRQNEVAAAYRQSRGARRENVIAVLSGLLGSDFVGYYTVPKTGPINLNTAAPATVGNYVKPGTPAKFIRFSKYVFTLNTPVSVQYTNFAGLTDPLRVGQKLGVDYDYVDRSETVTITALGAGTFTATFTKPHNTGTIASTGRTPFLTSTKRINMVILTDAAARDAEKRRKVHRAMRRLLRGVSGWFIVAENSPGSGDSGPFTIGSSEINHHTIGLVSA